MSQTLTATATSEAGEQRKVVFAASLGTVFEWYDFILFGSLAPILAAQFFSTLDPTTGLIFALLVFAAGFIARPFGAVVFGRLGDVVGRKYTFLVTIVIMGVGTFSIGLVPSYASIGLAAPIILVFLRILQGLAVGGEYGGAVVYVAENAPANRRGAFTSWIQTTGTIGLLLSLLVSLGTRSVIGDEAFQAWGWRIPFLLSIVLLAVSVWIRLKLHESPVFAKMKREGTTSQAPLSEAFGQWRNLKVVLLALFGLTAGFGVMWYTTQFYVLLFLTETLGVEPTKATVLVIIALALATPFFVIFGRLSDKIGRKKLIMCGLLLAAVAVFPVFKGLTHYANPALETALAKAPVTVVADPDSCKVQLDITGTRDFTSSCDVVSAQLATAGVSYKVEDAPPGTVTNVRIGDEVLASPDFAMMPAQERQTATEEFVETLGTALQQAGYPAQANAMEVNEPMVVLLIFLMVLFLTMAYGPASAMLVELFPARIRYSAISLPYHLGTGFVGGLMPATAFALVVATGNIYYGLWFPVVVTSVTVAIGVLFLKETKGVNINS